MLDMCTGVVGAFMGQNEGEVFIVKDYIFPSATYIDREIDLVRTQTQYFALVSGLEIGNPQMGALLPYMLVQLFEGQFEGITSADISCLIVLGDNLYISDKVNEYSKNSFRCAAYGQDLINKLTQSSKDLDLLCMQLAAQVPLFLMPGEKDLMYQSIPQQPYFQKFFPKAGKYSTFKLTTNPVQFEIEGIDVLCTSGQNIKSQSRFEQLDLETIDFMQQQIQWKLVAPSAPDDLLSFPEFDGDPFIIEKQPHLYVVGNMKSFEQGISCDGKTRLISVPKFCETGCLVLVDVSTLDAQMFSFKAS